MGILCEGVVKMKLTTGVTEDGERVKFIITSDEMQAHMEFSWKDAMFVALLISNAANIVKDISGQSKRFAGPRTATTLLG